MKRRNSLVKRLGARSTLGVLLACCLLFVAFAPSPLRGEDTNPFRDVPKDHWSVQAIQKLVAEGIIEGFPDGTFKGRKVITRYDLAVHIARLLARIDTVKAAGGQLTPEDTLTVTRLTNEYRSELDLLGVRVDGLEKRIQTVEKQAEALDKALSNVRIEGYYQVEQVFVDEPMDYTNTPYSRDLWSNPNTVYKEAGLYPLSQTVYLRFIGTPYIGGTLRRNLETFVELKGVLSGLASDRLLYRFSDPPIAGDELDDFATQIEDQRRISMNKAHLRIKSKRMNIRMFASESVTDLSDPAVILTQDAYGWSFDQGLEFSGGHKKFSYFGSVLKDISTWNTEGNDPADLTKTFEPEQESEKDAFNYRLTFEPFKGSEKSKHSFLLGTSYAEAIFSYEKEFDFNRVVAYDMKYGYKGDHDFRLTLESLISEGQGDRHDTAFRMDASYKFKNFLATFKGYNYGRRFSSVLSQYPFVDTWINDNWRRGSTAGEQLSRTQLRYDFKDTLFRNIKNLTVTGLFETKRFEDNPDSTSDDDTSNITGTRYYVQALADLTDKTHIEFKHERRRDVQKDEIGEYWNSLNVDVKAWKGTSVVGELEWIDDYDSLDASKDHFSSTRGKFTLNSQINKWLFASGYWQVLNNMNSPWLSPVNGKDLFTVGGESTINLSDRWSFKFWAERNELENRNDSSDDNITDVFVGELGFNFTRALKMRFVHGIQDIDNMFKENEFLINDYMELRYRPTEETEMRFTYGYEYENPSDRYDNGPLNFWRTEKLWKFSAKTDF